MRSSRPAPPGSDPEAARRAGPPERVAAVSAPFAERADTERRVAVGVSGGVDSAVALARIVEGGADPLALYMKNWDEDDDGPCPAAEDLEMAGQVCDRLGVELRTVNFSHEYWERVFAHFIAEHLAGRTPNPDVLCNTEVKFDAFVDFAADLGAERIATGHYARVVEREGRLALLRGLDGSKDQSYFLHGLDQRQLAKAEFPVGALRKRDVRDLAAELGLAPHARADSTGICFIGERPFREFLSRWVEANPGPILSLDGERLGEHGGLAFHTIGQRKGLAIGGRRGRGADPWYVARKDLERNALVVVQGRDHPALLAGAVETEAMHWISGCPPELPLACTAKIRYRQADATCVVAALDDVRGDGGRGDGRCLVRFDEPQWAAAPGQSVVLYAGDECLGGAVIGRATG